MSGSDNGIIRIGRKGRKKFAFGDGSPFEVDVVDAWRQWIALDNSFRPEEEDDEGLRPIPVDQYTNYYQAVVDFCNGLAGTNGGPHSCAEALDFLARLREQYDELADFFQPKSRKRPDSSATSAAPTLQFSEEEAPANAASS